MAGLRVATRYAKSILDLAIEQGRLEEVYKDMLAIRKACDENEDLVLLLKSPIINYDKKLAVLKKVFEGRLSELTIRFVEIITRKGREKDLPQIARSLIDQYKAHKNIQTVKITTAIPLDEGMREQILKIVRSKVDAAAIELEERTDESLIGGFVLRMGDEQINESIKYKLQKLGMSFSKNPYVKEY